MSLITLFQLKKNTRWKNYLLKKMKYYKWLDPCSTIYSTLGSEPHCCVFWPANGSKYTIYPPDLFIWVSHVFLLVVVLNTVNNGIQFFKLFSHLWPLSVKISYLAVHSKCWLKYAFQHFLLKKLNNGKKS